MTENNVILEVKGLQKSFGDNHVLKGIDTVITRGEKVVVVGKEALHYDEQNNPVPADLIDRLNKAATIIPVEKSPDATAIAR